MKQGNRYSGTINGSPATFTDARFERPAPQVIESSYPELDPDWSGTDSNGHRHVPDARADEGGTVRVAGYPTLVAQYGETYWCAECRDEHRDFLGYFCRECGEKVEPGIRAPRPVVIPAPWTMTLTGYADELPAAVQSGEVCVVVVDGNEMQGKVDSVNVSSGDRSRFVMHAWQGVAVGRA